MIGQTIAQYKILEKLGEGGMGVVYKAKDTRLERDVALKFLRPELIKTEKDKKRFFREARALAALDHPNICAVHELDEADGHSFIAMAFVEGKDLREIVEEDAPLSMDRILDLMRQIGLGVQAAHEKNVIHRDIKSTNIIVSPQGHARILDFGLARLSDSSLLTTEGTTMGTILYMSPEQATGDIVDHRTDIWALGVLFYELITGTFPFKSEFDQATVYMILNEEPKPLADYRSDALAVAQEIIDKTLAKEVVDRYQSAAELVEAIDRLAGKAPAEATVPKTAPPAVKIDPNLIAIFDFANDGSSTSDDWLSGGIAETLTADLKRVRALRMVSRQQIGMAAAGVAAADMNDERITNLGKSFGAKWAVWGSYERSGDSIRIKADFYESPEGKQIDTITTNGSMGDVFKLQNQIVSRLTDILEVKLTTSEVEKIQREETGDEKAYEFYAKARQRTNQMGVKDFEETKRLYERAIELDPDYALAYAGFANLHVFRHVAMAQPKDLDRGIELAEKAIEIDPDFAEPYLWLSYARMRQEDFDKSLAAGRRAVELEENNHFAHYFHGGAVVLACAGLMERWGKYSAPDIQYGVHRLKRALELNPSIQPGQMWLGWFHTLYGQYDQAMPYLEKAVKLEEALRAKGFHFVGGQTLRGNLLLRLRQMNEAPAAYKNSLSTLEKSQHVYRDSFIAQTHCGLGDVSFALGDFDESLKHYGKAVEVAETSPSNSGIGFFYVRGCAGMAKAFDSLGVPSQVSEKISQARATLEKKEGFNFFWSWDACDAQAYYDLASAYAELRQNDNALQCLQKAAIDLGWRDLPQLESDESFSDLMDDPAVHDIIEQLKKTVPIE